MSNKPESGGTYDNRMFSHPNRFDPAAPDDVARYGTCRLCGQPFEVGQRPTLMTIGPMDVDNARKAAQGRAFSAEAVVVHQDCVYGEDLTWE